MSQKIKLVYRGVDYNFIKECTKKIKKNEKKKFLQED